MSAGRCYLPPRRTAVAEEQVWFPKGRVVVAAETVRKLRTPSGLGVDQQEADARHSSM